MNKKFFKKSSIIFFYLLTSPLFLAFSYNKDNKKEDAIFSLNYKNNKLNLSFSYFNFYNMLTENLASDFNFNNIQSFSGAPSVDTPGFYDNSYVPHKGFDISKGFNEYLWLLSKFLENSYNNKKTGPAEFILYVYPFSGESDLPWQKGEILAKIPLNLPDYFTGRIAEEIANDTQATPTFHSINWPIFTKTLTLSKNYGTFGFYIFYDQVDHASLPKLNSSDKEKNFASTNGLKNLSQEYGNTYVMDLDRNEPSLDLTVYGEGLGLISEGGTQDPCLFSFDNPNGNNDFSIITVMIGIFTILLSISCYFPVVKYVRNKI